MKDSAWNITLQISRYLHTYISNLASLQSGLFQSARLRHLSFFVMICYFQIDRYQNCGDDRSLECTIPSARANAVRAGLDNYQINRAVSISGVLWMLHLWIKDMQNPIHNIHVADHIGTPQSTFRPWAAAPAWWSGGCHWSARSPWQWFEKGCGRVGIKFRDVSIGYIQWSLSPKWPQLCWFQGI